MTREEHIREALDWAEGRRSWTNSQETLGGHGVVAVMDAMEVIKHVAASLVAPTEEASSDE